MISNGMGKILALACRKKSIASMVNDDPYGSHWTTSSFHMYVQCNSHGLSFEKIIINILESVLIGPCMDQYDREKEI